MNTLNYNRIQFLLSVNHRAQLPPDNGAEVAFSGRSNAGKSSALNSITGIKGLARTSKTPGRTQLINFFELDSQRRLVDLPGYGYAKVPEAIKHHWEKLLTQYFTERQSLKGIILLVDIRHPLKALDQQMLEWSASRHLPIHILLTKADKLNYGAIKKTLLETEAAVKPFHPWITVQPFSSFNKTGLDEVKQKLNEWLQII